MDILKKSSCEIAQGNKGDKGGIEKGGEERGWGKGGGERGCREGKAGRIQWGDL